MLPGSYDTMKLNVILGVPPKYQYSLDLDEIEKVFPFGKVKFVVQDGGLVVPCGITPKLSRLSIPQFQNGSLDSNKNEDMLIVAVAVQIGF